MKQKIVIPIWICSAIIGFVITYFMCPVCMWFVGIPLFIIINVGIGTGFFLMNKNSKNDS